MADTCNPIIVGRQRQEEKEVKASLICIVGLRLVKPCLQGVRTITAWDVIMRCYFQWFSMQCKAGNPISL